VSSAGRTSGIAAGRASGIANRTRLTVSSSRAAILLLLMGGVAYAWLVCTFLSPYAGGADSSGYLNFARLLTHGQVLAPVRALPHHAVSEFGAGTFQPQGFMIRDDSGLMAPTYSVGLPLHLALAIFAAGLKHAVALVNVLAALSAAALTYASCRHLQLKPVWSAGATLALCFSPFFLNSALQPMSDLLATTWALAALYLAMRSREGALWPILCGAAFGIAVLIRPTNALLAFPLLVGLGINLRRLAGAALGTLPFALFVLYLNFRLFGSPLTTGYGSPLEILKAVRSDITQPYSVAYVEHHLTYFAYWIVLYMGPLMTCALLMPLFRHGHARAWVMQAVWIVVVIGFYAFYQPAGDAWTYVRFLLPCLPQLVMLATAGVAGMWERLQGTYQRPVRHLPPFHRLKHRSAELKTATAFAIVMLSIAWMAVATYRLEVLKLAEGEEIFPKTAQWVLDHLPANAVIWSSGMSGTIYYHTPFPIVRFDFIDKDKVPSFFAAAQAARLPMYAVLWPDGGEVDQLASRVGGSWRKIGEIGLQRITILESVR
jgi:Dolichyl-phosphate-mannose-protein mannosyltransferase